MLGAQAKQRYNGDEALQATARMEDGVAESHELTLGELVGEAELGLTILTGDLGLSTVIMNVHHSDLSDPTPWMAPGTLLITHGADLARSTADAASYLDAVSEKTAALVVAVGECLDRVPPEAIAYARRLGMPVVEAPRTLALRDIFSYVYHSLSSLDMHWLRRALAVQSQLLDLLVEEKGAADIVARLSDMLDLAMVLFDADGLTLAVARPTGPIDTDAIWRAVADAGFSGGPQGVLEAGRERIYVRPVMVHGELTRVLVAVVPHAQVTSILVDITLSHAQRLIGVSLLAEREALRFRRNMTSALLRDLLAREEGAHEFTEKLSAVGIDIANPWRVAVLGADRPDSGPGGHAERQATDLWQIVDAVEGCLHALQTPALVTVMKDVVVILAVFVEPGREGVRRVFEQVHARAQECAATMKISLGVSGGWVGPSRPAALFRQAEEACRAARDGAAATKDVVLFDEVDSKFRLLGGQSPDALAAMRDRLILPLTEHDRVHHTMLIDTLRVYFRNGMSVRETTKELYVHRNTLYKRLGRIEELLGLDLSRMDDITELYVSFEAAELLAASAPAR